VAWQRSHAKDVIDYVGSSNGPIIYHAYKFTVPRRGKLVVVAAEAFVSVSGRAVAAERVVERVVTGEEKPLALVAAHPVRLAVARRASQLVVAASGVIMLPPLGADAERLVTVTAEEKPLALVAETPAELAVRVGMAFAILCNGVVEAAGVVMWPSRGADAERLDYRRRKTLGTGCTTSSPTDMRPRGLKHTVAMHLFLPEMNSSSTGNRSPLPRRQTQIRRSSLSLH
jgi:hypothetical protein